MNRNVLIVLAGGVLIAILVAMMMQASLKSNRKEQVRVEQEPRVMIVVAAEPIKVGQNLSNENLRWQSWPKASVFEGAIVREDKDKKPLDQIKGRARRPLAKNEPVTASSLVPPGANYLAASLGEGMRAVTIPVGASTSVGGFIGPGDYVDVMLTYSYSMDVPENNSEAAEIIQSNLRRFVSETILQNVKVLAIDQSITKPEKTRVGKTATLEVTPKQAEQLQVARKMGDLALTLRKMGDETVRAREEMWPLATDERLISIADDVQSEIGPSHKSNYVRLYTGGTVQSVPVSP